VTFPAGVFEFVTQTQDYNQDKTGISTVSPKLRRDALPNAIRIRASLNSISQYSQCQHLLRCSLKTRPTPYVSQPRHRRSYMSVSSNYRWEDQSSPDDRAILDLPYTIRCRHHYSRLRVEWEWARRGLPIPNRWLIVHLPWYCFHTFERFWPCKVHHGLTCHKVALPLRNWFSTSIIHGANHTFLAPTEQLEVTLPFKIPPDLLACHHPTERSPP